MKLNLKGWSKVHSAKDHSILENDQGHQLKILHSPLDPKTRGQLAELPVKEAKGGSPNNPKLAESKKEPHYAKGGNVDPTQQHLESGDKIPNAIEKQVVTQGKKALHHYAEGTKDEPIKLNTDSVASGDQPEPQAPTPTPDLEDQPYIGNAITAPTDAPYGTPTQTLNPQSNDIPQTPDAPISTPTNTQTPSQTPRLGISGAQQPQSPDQDIFGTNAYYGSLAKGINEQKAGLSGQASAESQTAQGQAQALQNQVNAQKQQQQDYQAHYQALDNERQAFQKDAIQHDIDPKRYWGSMDTGHKVATTIGVMLGGLGGALTHQANPVLGYLSSQIERDIEAQKINLGTRKTLLEANMKQFGNLRDATDMTRIMMQDQVKNEMQLAASKSGDQMAQARMLQGIGAIDHDNAQALGQIAMRQSLLSGARRGTITPSQYILAVVPESEKAGVSKEVKEAQDASQFRDNTLSSLDQLYKTDTVGNRVMNPIQSAKQVAALKNVTLDKLTKDTSGRVTPETTKLIGSAFDTILANPETYKVQRNAINNILTSTMHYPLAEQWIPRDVLTKGRYDAQGQTQIPHVPIRQPK